MYARSGHARRVSGVSGDSAGRNISGRYSGTGRAYGRHRRAVDQRFRDCQRSGRGVARAGQEQHQRVCGSDSISPGIVHRSTRRLSGLGRPASGWLAGRPGRQPLSAHRAGARVFADGRRSPGHAHGSQPGPHRGRACQFYVRERIGRLDFSIRRRKEVAENRKSNRAGAADFNHRAIGSGDRRGCAPRRAGCIRPRKHSWRCAWP